MKPAALLLTFTCLGAGCGSLENEPLLTGVIRGQVLGADQDALVMVLGHEELTRIPDAEGRFELVGVPVGSAELLVLINFFQSRRLTVEVGAASIVELGEVAPTLSGEFEVYLKAPGGQRVTGGRMILLGTPLSSSVRPPEDEAEVDVPAGCYDAEVRVPGLGVEVVSGCVPEGGVFKRILTFPVPDGSPGREGCPVTGCQGLLTCQADLSCG